jgi:hypothetical protein
MTEIIEEKITNLKSLKHKVINEADYYLIDRLFDIREDIGELIYPANPEIIKVYGKKEDVVKQNIIKVTNLITYESSLFNELRSSRPFQKIENLKMQDEIEKQEGCFFCIPEAYHVTPSDTFIGTPSSENDLSLKGRIKKETCFSASNAGKYDGYHGLVVFNDHQPYSFDSIQEYVDCSIEWARAAHEKDKFAIYFFYMWNCLWRAGGSIIHGHNQMSLTKGMHYGRIEYLLRAMKEYEKRYEERNYFDDLFRVHEMLGLGFEKDGVRIMANLTPIKEKEILLMSNSRINKDTINTVKKVLPRTMACYNKKLGVMSFNLGLICSPSAIFSNICEEENARWAGFPVIIRIVDRGDLANRSSDIGAMELYASSVISSDPYKVIEELKAYI